MPEADDVAAALVLNCIHLVPHKFLLRPWKVNVQQRECGTDTDLRWDCKPRYDLEARQDIEMHERNWHFTTTQ